MWLLYILAVIVGLFVLLVGYVLLHDHIARKKAEKRARRDRELIRKYVEAKGLFPVQYDFSKFNELKANGLDGDDVVLARRAEDSSIRFSAKGTVQTEQGPEVRFRAKEGAGPAEARKSDEKPESVRKPVETSAKEPVKRLKADRDWVERYVNKVEACLTDKREVEVCGFPELEARLRMAIKDLMDAGVPLQIIHKWLDSMVSLSRLTITKQYRILLNDYGNLEIKMGPLPKTVFFFYLLHPEGMSFTDLQDHRDELVNIYSHVTNFDDPVKIEDSIDRLIDPLDNSISEKCSAVRTAFVHSLDPSVAQYYYVSGKQGDKKFIRLDRRLVKWEVKSFF